MSESLDDIQLKVETDKEQAVCEFICGRNTPNKMNQEYTLKVMISHDGVLQKTLEVDLENVDVNRYEIKLENVYKDDVISIELCDGVSGERIKEQDLYFIVNARIIGESED